MSLQLTLFDVAPEPEWLAPPQKELEPELEPEPEDDLTLDNLSSRLVSVPENKRLYIVLESVPAPEGLIALDGGTGQSYRFISPEAIAPYTGAVKVWRLVMYRRCDRAECVPVREWAAFHPCPQICHCGQRPQTEWVFTGTMAISPGDTPPLKWPDSVLFPAHIDPNRLLPG